MLFGGVCKMSKTLVEIFSNSSSSVGGSGSSNSSSRSGIRGWR